MVQLNYNTYAIEVEKSASDFEMIYDPIVKFNRLKYKINNLYRTVNLDYIIGESEINCYVYIQSVKSDNPYLQAFYNTPIVISEVLGNSFGIVKLLQKNGCSLTDKNIFLIIRTK